MFTTVRAAAPRRGDVSSACRVGSPAGLAVGAMLAGLLATECCGTSDDETPDDETPDDEGVVGAVGVVTAEPALAVVGADSGAVVGAVSGATPSAAAPLEPAVTGLAGTAAAPLPEE
jgi:hypothetical protein